MTQDMQVPEHIAKRIAQRKSGQGAFSAIAEAFSATASTPMVSIKGSKFRLKEGGVETVVGGEMDVVIVAANPATSKVFFRDAYTSDSTAGPTCSSANGKTPDAHISDPVSDSCATCPNNVLGSKITSSGAKSKLCGDVRFIAVVPAGDPSKVYELKIPVTSMKPMREYVQELNNYGMVAEEVITRLGFDDAEYPRLTFTRNAFLSEKHIEAVELIKNSDEARQATRVDTTARALPSAPAGEAKTVAVPQEKAEAPAPKAAVKKEAKAEAPAPKEPPAQDLATVAGEDDLEAALDGLFD